jgi:hypothetical protein
MQHLSVASKLLRVRRHRDKIRFQQIMKEYTPVYKLKIQMIQFAMVLLVYQIQYLHQPMMILTIDNRYYEYNT